jgi:hypothetical protein
MECVGFVLLQDVLMQYFGNFLLKYWFVFSKENT